jgi:hypothetical protein
MPSKRAIATKPHTRPMSVRLPADLHAWLVQRAAETTLAIGKHTTPSDVLVQAIKDARRRAKKPKETK